MLTYILYRTICKNRGVFINLALLTGVSLFNEFFLRNLCKYRDKSYRTEN